VGKQLRAKMQWLQSNAAAQTAAPAQAEAKPSAAPAQQHNITETA
jgi:hypothetical protein